MKRAPGSTITTTPAGPRLRCFLDTWMNHGRKRMMGTRLQPIHEPESSSEDGRQPVHRCRMQVKGTGVNPYIDAGCK